MDILFFHPKLVHVPIALGMLMPLVAGGLALAWWRNWLPWRSWIVAVGLQAVLLASGVIALRSGEVEEERVERFVPEQVIEAHEETAEAFVIASGAVLGVMLLAGALGAKRYGLTAAAVASVGTVVVLVLGYQTGQAGGSLVYEHGAAQAYITTGAASDPGATQRAQREPDDDD